MFSLAPESEMNARKPVLARFRRYTAWWCLVPIDHDRVYSKRTLVLRGTPRWWKCKELCPECRGWRRNGVWTWTRCALECQESQKQTKGLLRCTSAKYLKRQCFRLQSFNPRRTSNLRCTQYHPLHIPTILLIMICSSNSL